MVDKDACSEKIEFSERKLILEGDIDPDVVISSLYLGYHQADEELFKRASLKIEVNGNILLSDLEEFMGWINQNSRVTDVKECSRWRITLERLT